MPVDVTWEKYFTAIDVREMSRWSGWGELLTGKVSGITAPVIAELLRERVADEFGEFGVGEGRGGGEEVECGRCRGGGIRVEDVE